MATTSDISDVQGAKVIIASHGSRGDCQPFVALGLGLKAAGLDPLIFTNPDHESLVKETGLNFVSNGLPFKELFSGEEVAKANEQANFLSFLDAIGKHNGIYAARQYETLYATIKSFKPDFIVAGSQHWADAVTLPLLLGVPTIPVNLSNSHTLDPYKAPFGLPSLPFGMNGMLWKLVFEKWIGGLKKSCGPKLEELSGKSVAEFFPTGEDVMAIFGGLQPDPFDFLPYIVAQDDTFVGRKAVDPARLVYVGNLTMPGSVCKGKEFGGEKASALDRFISSCATPPVYVGWGSVLVTTHKAMTLKAVRALKIANCKGIVLGGWSGACEEDLDDEPDSAELRAYCREHVFFTSTASHDAIFPRCAVIVHHGGIGTTIASVKSGRPTVITPVLYDQFDSAELVSKYGNGVGAAHWPKVTPEALAGHITTCLNDTEIISLAASLGQKLRARDGAREATDHLIRFLRETVRGGTYWEGFNRLAAKKKVAASRKVGCWTGIRRGAVGGA